MEYTCPACGYPKLGRPPYRGNVEPFYKGEPFYRFCPCCDFQYGVTDMDKGYTFQQWRQEWIAGGMVWDRLSHSSPPPDWNPAEQVAKVMHIEGGAW